MNFGILVTVFQLCISGSHLSDVKLSYIWNNCNFLCSIWNWKPFQSFFYSGKLITVLLEVDTSKNNLMLRIFCEIHFLTTWYFSPLTTCFFALLLPLSNLSMIIFWSLIFMSKLKLEDEFNRFIPFHNCHSRKNGLVLLDSFVTQCGICLFSFEWLLKDFQNLSLGDYFGRWLCDDLGNL